MIIRIMKIELAIALVKVEQGRVVVFADCRDYN